MNRWLILILSSIFFTGVPSTHATNISEQNPSTIKTYQIDLTGDGYKETIELKGDLLSTDSTYYPFVVAKIQTRHGNTWEVELPDGMNPSLNFIDVTNDGTKDLLYKSNLSNNDVLYIRKLYTFEENNFISIPLPKNSFVHAHFQDDFLANIYIDPHDAPVTVDVNENADDYIKSGIYQQNGTLINQQDIKIEPIHSISPSSKEETSTVIETLQYVSSMIDSNNLGMIQLRWKYKNHSWELLDSSWKE